jgi:hypothetical protein
MSCILSIIGKNLNVDVFIKESKLRPYKVVYKGEPKFKTKPTGEKKAYSGLMIQASKADFNDLNAQIKDTIRFLRRNKQKLQHISLTKEVQYATLDFGVDLRIDKKKVLTQSELFPSELLRLAGELDLDIELSIYPVDLEEILRNQEKAKIKL